ncbi:MAG: ECF transporter S component [Bacillota bacterium]|nr:ECF transporter S component [Bacillota bacterium]
MLKTKVQRITTTGMLMALGIMLPFAAAHGLGMQGSILLPMHIPVFLIGFLCGPLWGGICGLILPALNTVLTGMPPVFPMLPIMTAELFVYGLISGLTYEKTFFGKMKLGVYPCILIAMICGRIAYGLVFWAVMIGKKSAFWAVIGATGTGLPGIIIQLLLVPAIVIAVKNSFVKRDKDARASAINLIKEDTATCVIIKNNTIIKTEKGRGIGPVIEMYESGVLKDTYFADKIIGKAAAMIITLGGVKGCYGEVMSIEAEKWLIQHGIEADCGLKVETISNRTGDGMCPMEQTVQGIDDPQKGFEKLKDKLAQLRGN